MNRGLTRNDVADRSGLNRRVVERVETGYHANPQWETIALMLKGMGISGLTAIYGRRSDEDMVKDTADVA